MNNDKREFDHFSESYEELLNDPIRDRFSPGGTEFFHIRKRDLIREYFQRRQIDTKKLAYLDLGCGKGELATLLRSDFGKVAGCDPSEGMLKAGGLVSKGIEARVQTDLGRIPFEDQGFDFVTAVCVFHHVPLDARAALVREACRVLKPGGVFSVIEHNPYNPVTKLIVSRTPVDADAILLSPGETRRLFRESGSRVDDQRYFLYFPESLYRRLSWLETAMGKVPLGGQYAVFGRSAA